MSALDRLRAGLFSDPPRHTTLDGGRQTEVYNDLRRDANELADEIEAALTAKRRVVGDATKHCICASCDQGVDPWDVFCRWCGRKLVDE